MGLFSAIFGGSKIKEIANNTSFLGAIEKQVVRVMVVVVGYIWSSSRARRFNGYGHSKTRCL